MAAAQGEGGTHAHAALCPNCGLEISGLPSGDNTIPLESQRQIEALQAQVRLLTEKATAAVDKWADYEDELHQLRAQQVASKRVSNTTTPPNTNDGPISPRPSYYHIPSSISVSSTQIQNRISSFLSPRKPTQDISSHSSRKSTNDTPSYQLPPPSPGEKELMLKLEKEQQRRQAAEKKLDEGSGELEELSSQLFQQANEMVAAERRARAKLEARVEVLEKRDWEKRRRLEKLEGSLARIERVRGLLAKG